MMWKRFAAGILAVAMITVAGCSKPKPTGPSGGGDPGAPKEGGTLNLSMYSAPKGVFNPILYEDKYDGLIIDLVFSGMLRLNEKLEYVCDLCETFEVSNGNNTVTFKLKENLKWHDGKPVTTADVAFTFRTMLHPEYTGVRTGDFASLTGVQEMLDDRDDLFTQVDEKKLTQEQATQKNLDAWNAWLAGPGKTAIAITDARTIAFNTDEPYAPFLQSLAFAIIPEHVFKDIPIGQLETHAGIKQPIGTGPFKFVEYKTDQYAKLVQNPDYHVRKPYVETILYHVVDQKTAIDKFLAGELDYVEMSPDEVKLLTGKDNIKIETRPDFGYQYMGLNHDNPLFKEKKVRQALAYAINRQAMVDTLLNKYGTLMNSHMPPALWAYDPSQLNPYPYDPTKAAELLKEAGWTEKNKDGYLVKDGKLFEFTLKYPSGNKVREKSAPLIQANLKDAGIKVNLELIADFGALSKAIFDARTFDAYLMGWSLSVDPDPGAIFLPDNKWGKVTGWTNARNAELIKQGTRVFAVSERKPMYVEWAKILNDELPYVFLYSQNVVDAVRTDRIQGLKPDARGTLWNIWELWVTKSK